MLKVQNLRKYYNHKKILSDISFEVEDNQIAALVGPSGCGKTTLLNIISGLNSDYTGFVQNNFHKVGYVFQEDRILPWLTVFENIKIVREDGSDREVNQFIEMTGLKNYENYFPEELSGGMKQRCAIARALYFGSDFLLMDEPFKSLDYILKQQMLLDLKKIQAQQKNSILFVTHDIDEAIFIADKILVLQKNPCKIVKEIYLNQKTRTGTEKDFLKDEILSLIKGA
ncbi:ABC transporter ATP-binding protein [Treponema pectinovorum]|uniref:ABC transporter ATP-binding protein n=1 Tax=Treponema pectinovorum TaxID=164 RepID=UPI0011F3B78C|nr:ATP-binding cassette domain-containing protein [Treponema pectinovorum]